MKTLRLILWDQLSLSISSLQGISHDDTVFMCEVRDEVTRVKHHPKKIALWFAAMRHFAEELKHKAINVHYVEFEDPLNTHHLTREVQRVVQNFDIQRVIVTEPGEYHLKETIKSWKQFVEIDIRVDDRFLCTITEFKAWASGKKELRMEYFYRNMRKKYNVLMEADGEPVGGAWNYDKENRKPPSSAITPIKRISHKKSDILNHVLDLWHCYIKIDNTGRIC